MDEPAASPPGDQVTPVPNPSTPLWRNEGQHVDRRRRRSVVIALGLIACTVGALIYLLTWLDPISRPVLVWIEMNPGLTTIPGWTGDRQALLGVSSLTSLTAQIGSPGQAEVLGGELERRKSELQGKTVIIYLAAPAWVDRADDTPRLLLAGRSSAKLGNGAPAGIRLESIMTSFRPTGGPPTAGKADRPDLPKQVLLVLDIHPLPWSIGDPITDEDLGQTVLLEAQRLLQSHPNLTVLASCAGGQSPGTSPALGRSAFGYYVEQGLRGAADTSSDRRLTSQELAIYVRNHVERWSRLCRSTVQSPWMITNSGIADFPLVTVPAALPVPAVLPKEAPAYPTWLLDAWRIRDAGLQLNDDRLAPRPFSELEAALLQAERAWIGGVAEADVRKWLRDQLPRLRNRIENVKSITPLPSRSLAMARGWGAADDPDLIRATREWLAKRPRPAPDAKPADTQAANTRAIAEFLGPLAGKSDFTVASAIMQVAAELTEPSHDQISALDQLLAVRQPQPAYTETLTLRRLAQSSVEGWRPDRARFVLNLALRTAQVQSNPVALIAARSSLDDADRLRHEAESLALLPGFSNPTDADRLLVAALGAVDSCLVRVDKVSQIQRLLDEAPRILGASVPLLAGDDDLSRVWLAAADQSQTLRAKAVAGRLTEPGGGQSDRLAAGLNRFREASIHAQVLQLSAPDAVLEADDYAPVATLMATTLPSAEDRATLWKARINLDRNLVGVVLGLDRRDGRQLAAPPDERGMRSVAIETAVAAPNWFQRELMPAVAALVQSPDHPAGPVPDDPALDPNRVRRLAEWTQLGQWLLARYEFEAFDPEPSEFFAAAARDYGRYRTTTPQRLTIAVDPAPSRLTPTQPLAEVSVRLGLVGVGSSALGRSDSAWVDLISANRGLLDVRPEAARERDEPEWPVKVAVDRGQVAVRLRLPQESKSGPTPPIGPLPQGVLVRARWEGRTYHHPLPLEIETAASRLQPRLTAGSAAQDQPISVVDLRPSQGKALFHLQVRNPADHDRTVTVQLLDRQGPIAGAVVTQTIRDGSQAGVVFGPPGPDLDAGLVEIQGPLTIRVADVAHPAEAVNLEIPIQLVPPSDLVRVVGASYDPTSAGSGGKSRLEIRLRSAGEVAGPAPLVELQLLPDRIPGLVFAGEGTFRGTLPKPGAELTLFAEGLQMNPRAEEEGVVYLSVDGVERALVFQARFPRRGPRIPLILDTRTALRLRGDRVAAVGSLWPLRIEVDSPPPSSRIDLKLGQYAVGGFGDQFNVAQQFDLNAQRARFRLNPRGPDGALVLDASVRDPAITLDLAGIRGQRLMLAKLINDQGQTVADDQLDLVIDDRPPAGVRFVNPPRFALRSGSVRLRAEGAVPASGLKEVTFFVGRPGADLKRPANAATSPGRPADAGRTTWQSSLVLADAKPGPLDLSVEFVAGNGLSRFDTTSVLIVESIPIEPGEVQGVVKEGSRPQPNFDVQVLDEKGAELRKVQTDAQGRFVVQGLPPGKYQVVSTKLTPPTRGTAPAVVAPNKITEVEIQMLR